MVLLPLVVARARRRPHVQTLDSMILPYALKLLIDQRECPRGAHSMKLRYEARASISFADKVLAICGIGLAAA
jgi:hypothetical protein